METIDDLLKTYVAATKAASIALVRGGYLPEGVSHTHIPGKTYEEGVQAALAWVLRVGGHPLPDWLTTEIVTGDVRAARVRSFGGADASAIPRDLFGPRPG